jgi:putative redox protein
MRTAEVQSREPHWRTDVALGEHALIADEPSDVGGGNAGASPHDFLLAALGACTAITVRMYAERKGWPLEDIQVHLEQEPRPNDGEHGEHHIRRVIHLHGPLDAEQRGRLLDIANKCPVHKTLSHPIRITSSLGDGADPPGNP